MEKVVEGWMVQMGEGHGVGKGHKMGATRVASLPIWMGEALACPWVAAVGGEREGLLGIRF